MTTPLPGLPEGFTAEPYQLGGWRISLAGVFAGAIFPVLPADPAGRWMARRYGKPAKPCRDRRTAVDHIVKNQPREGR
jgi:hypothetical protein